MTESGFVSEIIHAIRSLPRAIAEPCEGRTGRGPRQTPPWDLFAIVDGKTYLIEAKLFRGPSYPLDGLRDRQIHGLIQARAAGAAGAAFVIRLPMQALAGAAAIVVSPEAVAKAKAEAERAGRKSVHWHALFVRRETLVTRGGGSWCIEAILRAAEWEGRKKA